MRAFRIVCAVALLSACSGPVVEVEPPSQAAAPKAANREVSVSSALEKPAERIASARSVEKKAPQPVPPSKNLAATEPDAPLSTQTASLTVESAVIPPTLAPLGVERMVETPQVVEQLPVAELTHAAQPLEIVDAVPPVAPTATPVPPLKLTGSVQINFQSRDAVHGKDGGTDNYKVDLNVAGFLRIHGIITRKPRAVGSILGREKTPRELEFNLGIDLIHPDTHEQMRAGRWSGVASVSKDGVYTLSGGEHPLAIATKVAADRGGVNGAFSGAIQGKPEQSAGFLRQYTRWIGGRKVSYQAQHTDPLEFRNLVLAAGPIESYPEVSVNGNLDYDYDTGNWITGGIVMKYRSAGNDLADTVTGTIKWIEDPNRKINGRGQYQVNLRFNENDSRQSDEGRFFEAVSDEEAFFVPQQGIPSLVGTISYLDRFDLNPETQESTVLSSRISYDLFAPDLSKQQLVNFLKLWLLLSGPVNDE